MLDLEDWYFRALEAKKRLSASSDASQWLSDAVIVEALQLLLEREIGRTRKELVEGDRG